MADAVRTERRDAVLLVTIDRPAARNAVNRAVAQGVALELALTGDPIDAERAHALGLVNRLAEPGTAVDVALELAAAVARNGPLALAATQEVLERQWAWDEDEFWERQLEITAPVFGSEDAREGALAFAEKRDPVWRGR